MTLKCSPNVQGFALIHESQEEIADIEPLELLLPLLVLSLTGSVHQNSLNCKNMREKKTIQLNEKYHLKSAYFCCRIYLTIPHMVLTFRVRATTIRSWG